MMQTVQTSGFSGSISPGTRTAGASFDRRMPGHLDRITQAHKVEEKEPKFSAKAAKLIVLLTAGLLAFSILLYGFVSLFGGGISRGGHSASTQQLEVIVGNSALRIPANTIRFQSQRHAGAHGRIELYLHWPTLSGYNDVLEASFSRASDQSDLIFLSLEPRTMSLDMSGRIEPIYSRFFDGPAKKASAGLIRQPLSPDGGFIDEDLYYEASSPYPFVTRCARPKSTISTPFCIRDIHVGKDLMLTYRFHVRHLPDWIKIDRRIRQYAKALLITR